MAKLTPEACRAARALLGITAKELGARAGIASESINKFENGRPMRDSNRSRLIEAFNAAGVEITNGDGTGARLIFESAYAFPRLDGSWGVFTRWREGDPGDVVSVATARLAAAEARSRGDERVALALEAAAAKAESS